MTEVQLARNDASATVLVVEDERLIRVPIADCFRDTWRVLEAASGEEAKAMFVAGESIDVVFSDVQMSSLCDGFALARWVHEHHPKVHMLLTSGVMGMTKLPAEVCAQASTFAKPYDYDAVIARIQVLLANSPSDIIGSRQFWGERPT